MYQIPMYSMQTKRALKEFPPSDFSKRNHPSFHINSESKRRKIERGNTESKVGLNNSVGLTSVITELSYTCLWFI